MSSKKPLILVDGSSFFYRAFHALPPLTNSKKQPTGAIYGVINMLRKMQKNYPESCIAVIFDAPGKTFRDELYPEYKSHRPPMPTELSSQIQPLFTIIKAMGFPLLQISGVEADDVIGTLTQQAVSQGMATMIATNDKDMAQLIQPNITIINTMTNTWIDDAAIYAKFGVHPAQIIDYLALVGDKVDNIPGVPNVGPKTAAKWLEEFLTLENLMQHAGEIKGKVGENLRNSLEFLPLSKQLVSIKTDCVLDITVQDLKHSPSQQEKLKLCFHELEFKTWLLALDQEVSIETKNFSEKDSQPSQKNSIESKTIYKIYTIYTELELTIFLKQLNATTAFSFHIETTNHQEYHFELVGFAFCIPATTTDASKLFYIPLKHDYTGAPPQLSSQTIFAALKPTFENMNIIKIGHNLKNSLNILRDYDINLHGELYDPMLESYVLNSTVSRHHLEILALKYLNHPLPSFTEIAGIGKKQLTFNQITIEKAAIYATKNVNVIQDLHDALWPQLQHQKKLKQIFLDIEMRLLPVLAKIERHGVLIDAKALNQQSAFLAEQIHDLEQRAFFLVGEKFNLSSPKQLQEILYKKMRLPVFHKTPKGQPSTAEATLQELAEQYELPKIILEHRSFSKLKSTYTDSLPAQINPRTGRVHTSYQQAVAATGRLSSSEPNLQNIPIRTEQGRLIRKAFIAPEHYLIVSADYSQIELRIMAHLSHDTGLLTAFANNQDIHTATASEVFGVAIDKVDANHRRSAKAINFGLIYGMSSFGLAKQLNISRDAAQQYINRYFEKYPGVKNYMEQTRTQAHQIGYVETIFGRRLNLPEINVRNQQRKRAAERTAINAPMQGTAADIIKLAMIHIDDWLAKSSLDVRMVMQVHDELVFEIAQSDLQPATNMIKELMENSATLDVPLLVEIGSGRNWDEAH